MIKEEILNEIDSNPLILEEVDKKYLSDAEFILEVLKKKPILCIRFVDKSLLSNVNFIKKAFRIINDELFSCKINLFDIADKKVTDILLDNEEFLKENIPYLEFASDRIKNNEEFLLEILNDNSLYYASYKLKYISENLKGNKTFFLKAIKIDSIAFHSANYKLRSDLDLIQLVADAEENLNLKYTHPEDLYLEGGGCVNWIPTTYLKFITNRDYIINLLDQYPVAYLFLSVEFQKDEEIIELGLNYPSMAEYIPFLENFSEIENIVSKVINKIPTFDDKYIEYKRTLSQISMEMS